MACCTNCGTDNREGSRYCNECGSPLGDILRCAQCGVLNSPTSRFCNQCGGRLQPAAAASSSSLAETDLPAPVLPFAEGGLTLEFEAPEAADLLADQSLTAPLPVAEPSGLEPAIAQDLAAPTGAAGLAEVVLATEVLPLQEMAKGPVAAVSDADTLSPDDSSGGLPAVPAGVKAGAQEVLDSTWLDRWPGPPATAAPADAAARVIESPPPASPEPASATPRGARPATLGVSPGGPPARPEGRMEPAALDVRPLSGVAGGLVPPPAPAEQRPADILAAGIVRARSAPASLVATVAFAPAGSPHPVEAVPLLARIVADLRPPQAAGARQHPPHHASDSGRSSHRPFIVLVLLLVVGLAVALAFVTGHLPPDVSLARIGLR